MELAPANEDSTVRWHLNINGRRLISIPDNDSVSAALPSKLVYRVLRRESGYVVRGPDVAFILAGTGDEWEKPLSGGFSLPRAPDIAVEVVSPSNTATDMTRKVSEYLAAGSQRVWAVYPTTRTVSVHRADGTTVAYTDEDVITDEELLPGFSLPLTEIFR